MASKATPAASNGVSSQSSSKCIRIESSVLEGLKKSVSEYKKQVQDLKTKNEDLNGKLDGKKGND